MTAPASLEPCVDFAALQARALGTCVHETGLPAGVGCVEARDVVLRARFGRTAAGGEARSVHIRGSRVEIINLFLFPDPGVALPLYAMEFVVFGRRPVVGVMDVVPLSGNPGARLCAEALLREAHARHPSLLDAGDPPGWFQECRSGLDFFVRPEGLEGVAELGACHLWIWESLLRHEADAPLVDPPARLLRAAELRRYKDHHRVHSPGLPFLHRTYGAEWTDRFLGEFLFA